MKCQYFSKRHCDSQGKKFKAKKGYNCQEETAKIDIHESTRTKKQM